MTNQMKKTLFIIPLIYILLSCARTTPDIQEYPIFSKYDTIATKIPRFSAMRGDTLYFHISKKLYRVANLNTDQPSLESKNLITKEVLRKAYNTVKSNYPSFNFIPLDEESIKLQQTFDAMSFSHGGEMLLIQVSFPVTAPFEQYTNALHRLPFYFFLNVFDLLNHNRVQITLLDTWDKTASFKSQFNINPYDKFHFTKNTVTIGQIFQKGDMEIILAGTHERAAQAISFIPKEVGLSQSDLHSFYDELAPLHTSYYFSNVKSQENSLTIVGNKIIKNGKLLYHHPIENEYISDIFMADSIIYISTGSVRGIHGDSTHCIYKYNHEKEQLKRLNKFTNAIYSNSRYSLKDQKITQLRLRSDTLFLFNKTISND